MLEIPTKGCNLKSWEHAREHSRDMNQSRLRAFPEITLTPYSASILLIYFIRAAESTQRREECYQF